MESSTGNYKLVEVHSILKYEGSSADLFPLFGRREEKNADANR
jgi:hypothetical protein